MTSSLIVRCIPIACLVAALAPGLAADRLPRQRENLGRGVVAVHQDERRVFVSWRLLGSDPPDIAFDLYRATDNAPPARLNGAPIARVTGFVDTEADLDRAHAYHVRPVVGGKQQAPSRAFVLASHPVPRPFFSIPLRTPPGYAPNDASVGDLDGDGEFDLVLHQAGRGRDNAQRGMTDPPLLEAYGLDGAFLWRINLGRNIREGAHYTQFIVYDLDGDGRAEVACKTADGTVDGAGVVLGDRAADHRNADGYVLEGPESLTVFDGRTGKALATADYWPPRGKVSDWGDEVGNRVDRFLACVAYLDGRRPSLVMCRGYYTRTALAAWDWRGGQLVRRWTFDTEEGPPSRRAYRGQGNHNLSVADVDGDGRDEIIYGACCIDDTGEGLYSTTLGHGDALHVGDFDPDRPGLEVFGIHERPRHPNAVNLRDAATGRILWGKAGLDVGRGLALDIDPRHRGAEMWAAGFRALWNVKGDVVSTGRPRSCNMGIWWDADPLRELLDGVNIHKWNWETGTESPLLNGRDFDCVPNNGSKANPCLCADILGDWREELVCRTRDGRELRVFTTSIPTAIRIPTLMHDPVYRLGVAWQNVGYNQPPHLGFDLVTAVEAPGEAGQQPASAPLRGTVSARSAFLE